MPAEARRVRARPGGRTGSALHRHGRASGPPAGGARQRSGEPGDPWPAGAGDRRRGNDRKRADRKSVVEGKSVSVRVELGGRRIKKNKRSAERSASKNYTQTKQQ